MDVVPNIIAERYASPEMRKVFSPDTQIILERQLWITVMQSQANLGLDIPEEAIEAYRGVVGEIDRESIRERELVTRHDVKARIEEFNALAGYEHVHKGMTSRDATENVEQYQIREGLRIIDNRLVATLGRLAERAAEYSDLVTVGRTHNVAAQPVTLGKRFATLGEETLRGHTHIASLLQDYPLRGIKGAIGTQQDMVDLLGSRDKVSVLESAVAESLGFSSLMGSVGQVYPRSLDEEVLGALHLASAGPANLAKTIRLMAGNELITEGFKEGQVGSSAMPHKMNARSAERITGLHKVIFGYNAMMAAVAGDQWYEGDVSCSVVRRIAIPDAFYATDGLFQTTLTVLDELGAYPELIEEEYGHYAPFLTTTKILMAAVKRGMSREQAHRLIKDHAVATALDLREGRVKKNNLHARLANDDALPLDYDEIEEAIGSSIDLTGLASEQVAAFIEKVEPILEEKPEAATYKPTKIL